VREGYWRIYFGKDDLAIPGISLGVMDECIIPTILAFESKLMCAISLTVGQVTRSWKFKCH
jgi:hypothetical protein